MPEIAGGPESSLPYGSVQSELMGSCQVPGVHRSGPSRRHGSGLEPAPAVIIVVDRPRRQQGRVLGDNRQALRETPEFAPGPPRTHESPAWKKMRLLLHGPPGR